MLGYLAIILVSSLTTSTVGMFCSVLFRKTSVSMMTAYLVLIILFAMPVVVKLFAELIVPNAQTAAAIDVALPASPFAAAFSLPLHVAANPAETGAAATAAAAPSSAFWPPHAAELFLVFYLVLDAVLLGTILWLFNIRWRVAK